jgi:TRAP-type mannitol/chloroaromatic compound transport system permease large subunit
VKLYAAAFIPGFGLTAAYLLYILLLAMWKPHLAPMLPKEERNAPIGTILFELLVSFVPLTVLTIVVLAVIFFGLATPTESAAMGAVGALMLAIGYGADYSKRWVLRLMQGYVALCVAATIGAVVARGSDLRWLWITLAVVTIAVFGALAHKNTFSMEKLRESVYLTARTAAMVCWLFVGSAIFASVFALLGGQGYVERFVLGLGLNSLGFMIMAQAIIFLLGWPLEWTEIIIIFVPIFLPMLDEFGIDPLFFGVMVALNLQTSFLSPPVAMAPFYLKGVAPPQVSINEIFRGVMPYIWIVVLFMVLMYMFPAMALWLPDYMYTSR